MLGNPGYLTLNAANVFTARDNLRQATYGIPALAAAVKADTTMGFDASELHLTGHAIGIDLFT